MCIVESLLVLMHSWLVLFNDVVFDDDVDKISNIPVISKYLTMVISLVPHVSRVELGTLHT